MNAEKLLLTLKQQLKHKGFTYLQVGQHLGISSSSVKRCFADKSFSLQRIEQLCELLGLDLLQLMQLAAEPSAQLSELSWQQEQQLVDNPRLLLVGVCLLNRCSFDDIYQKYEYEHAELIGFFVVFDRFGVIELLANNRYRLKISPNFTWHANGPIQKFFASSVLDNFLRPAPQNEASSTRFLWAMLCPESCRELSRKINHLIEDYLLLSDKDKKLPMKEKRSSSLMLAFNDNWEPDIFQALQRKPKESARGEL